MRFFWISRVNILINKGVSALYFVIVFCKYCLYLIVLKDASATRGKNVRKITQRIVIFNV